MHYNWFYALAQWGLGLGGIAYDLVSQDPKTGHACCMGCRSGDVK